MPHRVAQAGGAAPFFGGGAGGEGGGKVEVPAVEPLVDDAAGVDGGAVAGGEREEEFGVGVEGAEGG